MMEVFNPTGATGATASFAPRLETLDGKKIGLLSNGHWQSERMLVLLQKLLRQAYPSSNSTFIPANDAIQHEKTIAAIVAEGYDAVIVGNAA